MWPPSSLADVINGLREGKLGKTAPGNRIQVAGEGGLALQGVRAGEALVHTTHGRTNWLGEGQKPEGSELVQTQGFKLQHQWSFSQGLATCQTPQAPTLSNARARWARGRGGKETSPDRRGPGKSELPHLLLEGLCSVPSQIPGTGWVRRTWQKWEEPGWCPWETYLRCPMVAKAGSGPVRGAEPSS